MFRFEIKEKNKVFVVCVSFDSINMINERSFIMSWCPDCKTEYREGFTKCIDCDTELTETLEVEEVEYDTEVFLLTAEDDNHANVIQSILRQYGIPIFKKYKETGGYLNLITGRTPFGIDIYVPSKSFQIAQDTIESLDVNKTEQEEPNIESPMKHREMKEIGSTANKKRIISIIIIIVLVTPIVISLLISIFSLLFRALPY